MRSIAMESGEVEDGAPLMQEPAPKSTKALLATSGGRGWWRMARVFHFKIGWIILFDPLLPYPDNPSYVP